MPVTVVIPTYQEKEALTSLLPMLRAFVPEANVLVVWDGPDDGTERLALDCGASVMRGPGLGLGAAIIAGIKAAPDDLVVVMDGDGQHPIQPVNAIISLLKDGAPFVAGARIDSLQQSRPRQLMSAACSLLARPLCPISDPMTGLFGVNRQTVHWENINPHTWKIGLEIAARLDEETPEIPYIFQPRIAGRSHAGIKPAVQFLDQIVRLYIWKIDPQQMLRFGVVGSSGIIVNMAVTITLVELLSRDYRMAAIGGIGVAMTWNYLWNKFWTFRKERKIAKTGSEALAR